MVWHIAIILLYRSVLNEIDGVYRRAFESTYKNQIKIVRSLLFNAVSNLTDSITEIEKKNGGSISQTDFLNTNEGTKAVEDFKEAVLKMKQVLPRFRNETYNFSLMGISEDTSLTKHSSNDYGKRLRGRSNI